MYVPLARRLEEEPLQLLHLLFEAGHRDLVPGIVLLDQVLHYGVGLPGIWSCVSVFTMLRLGLAHQITYPLLEWSMSVGTRPLGLYFVYSGLLCSSFAKSRYLDSKVKPSSARVKAAFLQTQLSSVFD